MRKPQSRVFRWEKDVSRSSLDPTTKHILKVLREWMDEGGGSCFPRPPDIIARSGRSKKTVQKHLKIAEAAGWIIIRCGSRMGQQWRRRDYLASWPVDFEHNHATDGKGAAMRGEGGAISAQKVGSQLPRDNTRPVNHSPARAGVREDGEPNTRKIDAQFRKWLEIWPRKSRKSDGLSGLRLWRGLTDAQREAALMLTPRYLRTIRDKSKLCGPETALRKRVWESDGVQVKAAFRGPLWMACYFWRLLQPSVQVISFTAMEETLIAAGRLNRDGLLREKRRKFGWPDANKMVQFWHEKRSFFCPVHVEPLAELFVWVAVESPLFAAWARLVDARDWPLPAPIGRGLFFPRVASLDGDLDEAVSAALAAFEIQAAGVFNERS